MEKISCYFDLEIDFMFLKKIDFLSFAIQKVGLYDFAGIWKEEGWELRRFMFALCCIFFWKRSSLMFHPSYQNGGKIVSIEKLPVGRKWLKN